MTRTELLTHLITDQIENRRFVDVDTFRDMYLHGLPGKLALLAVSRDGERILPIFENDYFHTELVDYTKVSETLGKEWIPVIAAHVYNRYPGRLPQTMLVTDGIVDERTLTRVFGQPCRWNHDLLGMTAFNFGEFVVDTLPRLSMYVVDREGARRIRLAKDVDEGRAHGITLDHNGSIRYVDRETGKTMVARMQVGVDTLDWNIWPVGR
jgi:hypothetical protein